MAQPVGLDDQGAEKMDCEIQLATPQERRMTACRRRKRSRGTRGERMIVPEERRREDRELGGRASGIQTAASNGSGYIDSLAASG